VPGETSRDERGVTVVTRRRSTACCVLGKKQNLALSICTTAKREARFAKKMLFSQHAAPGTQHPALSFPRHVVTTVMFVTALP